MPIKGVRSVASDVQLQCGLLGTTGKLYPLVDTTSDKETKTFMVSPCEHKGRVEQFYRPADCDCVPADQPKGYKTGDMLKGSEVNGTVVVMTPEEVAAARGGDADKKPLLDVSLSPADQFEAETVPSGAIYWFEPDRLDPGFQALYTIVSDGDVAAYGVMTLRNAEHFWRIVAGRDGGIVVQEHLRPQDLRHYEAPPTEMDERNKALAHTLAATLVEDFDPEKVRSDVVERMRQLIASKAGTDVEGVIPITAAKPKKVEQSLEDALAQALAAAQAAKAS